MADAFRCHAESVRDREHRPKDTSRAVGRIAVVTVGDSDTSVSAQGYPTLVTRRVMSEPRTDARSGRSPKPLRRLRSLRRLPTLDAPRTAAVAPAAAARSRRRPPSTSRVPRLLSRFTRSPRPIHEEGRPGSRHRRRGEWKKLQSRPLVPRITPAEKATRSSPGTSRPTGRRCRAMRGRCRRGG